jgi:PEGA domain
MQHSDFEIPTNGTDTDGTKAVTSGDLASQILTALDRGDHETAGNLLQGAGDQYPEDVRFLRLAAKQRRQSERFTRVYSLLKETHVAIEDDAFVRALGAFREAANLSQGFPDLEKAAFDVAVNEAEHLGDRNWRIARTLLEDVSGLSMLLVVPEDTWQQVRAAEREEVISNVLAETALAKPAELGRARERLQRTLERYPDDSGLQNRLVSIESTIEEKRKWDERQKCLKKLTDLRDSLQREEDPAQVGKFIAMGETLAAPYAAESEFSSVVEDIKHQVISSEKAAAALQNDRIDECLEECAWVLSRMRHHQLFLKLKQKAEERELALVDEYSHSTGRIKELLGQGKVAEAEALCAQASAKLPQFDDLRELSREIQQRKAQQDQTLQSNAESARRLAERGERSLLDHQFRAAEQAFGNALKMLPGDQKLPGHIIGMLHGYARAVARENNESAVEALKIGERLLPGRAVPADLVAALSKKREQAKAEAVRWSALSKISDLDARVEAAHKREQLVALRAEVQRNNFESIRHADVKEAAAALVSKIDGKTAALNPKQAGSPWLLKALPIAAAVVLAIGLSYWLNNRPVSAPLAKPLVVETTATTKPVPATGSLLIRSEVPGAQVSINGKEYTISNEPLKVELNADSYQVSGSRPGFKDFGPVTVAVSKAAETVVNIKLTPKPASLEIPQTAADTQIKIDGVLLAKSDTKKAQTKELAAGDHSIEVMRRGYVSKTMNRTLPPGGTLALSEQDLQLSSSDARTVASAKPEVKKVPNRASLPPVETAAVKQPKPDDSVLVARAEETDWTSSDHNSKSSLEDFLKKHPSGHYSNAASSAIADLDRKTRALEAQAVEEAEWKKVNRHDESSLESFLRDPRSDKYRNQAEIDLATLRLGQASRTESSAVLSVISRFASAWSSKDLNSIMALQKNLNKRAVKAELAQVKELTMHISPASAPQIEGSRAVVLCRRQASQTFSDGTFKQIPESIVSYLLAKHDGDWTIEGTR